MTTLLATRIAQTHLPIRNPTPQTVRDEPTAVLLKETVQLLNPPPLKVLKLLI